MPEDKFKTVFDNANDAIFIHDLEGRFLEVNRVACERLGYSREELLQLTPMDIDTPEYAALVPERLQELHDRGRVLFETAHVRRNGMVIPIELSSRLIEYDGSPAVLSIARDISERNQVEEALRQKRDLVESIVETAQVIVLVLDIEGRIVYFNPYMAAVSGYQIDQVREKDWFATFLPERDRERIRELFARAVSNIKTRGNVNPIVTKDGHEREIEWYDTTLKDADGKIVGVLAIGRDVTERKQAEEALRCALAESRQREAEVSALLEGSQATLEYRDFAQTARFLFDSCKNLIGATSGYVALLTPDGMKNEVLFLDSGGLECTADPSLPMPVRGLRSEAYNTRQAVYCNDFANSDWAKLLPGGHVDLDNVLFAPLVIEGKAVGLLGLANKPEGFTDRDVRMATAFGKLGAIALRNSRTLESLESSEERFHSVVQTASDAIITIDSRGNITFWNRAAEVMFGYSADEAIGRSLTFVMPERFHNAHRESISRILRTGESRIIGQTVEMIGIRKDASEFPIELSLATWKTGESTFFTGIIRDITERVRAEKQVRASLHEKEVLLCEIHHRVKNNLQLVSSLLTLQAESLEDPQALQVFQESQGRIQSIALVHQKLYQSPDLANIDVAEYIRGIVGYLAQAYRSWADLSVEVDGVSFSMDVAIPCGLIVNELVSNALKYAFPLDTYGTTGWENEIRITLGPIDDGRLALVVCDNGVGLPQGMDWQNSPTLGLQLVNMLTQQLKGTIELDRSAGTAFKITFAKEKSRAENKR